MDIWMGCFFKRWNYYYGETLTNIGHTNLVLIQALDFVTFNTFKAMAL